MDQINSNPGAGGLAAPGVSGDVPGLDTIRPSQLPCPTCGSHTAGPRSGEYLGGHEELAAPPPVHLTQLPLDLRNAVHKCALEVIATETRCVEWGAPAQRSIELAEEAITNMVSLALSSKHARAR